MPQLAYITRGNASPQGKPRVYFCCHPADQAAFLQPMAKDLLALVDCSVWYDPEPATPLSPEERSSTLSHWEGSSKSAGAGSAACRSG